MHSSAVTAMPFYTTVLILLLCIQSAHSSCTRNFGECSVHRKCEYGKSQICLIDALIFVGLQAADYTDLAKKVDLTAGTALAAMTTWTFTTLKMLHRRASKSLRFFPHAFSPSVCDAIASASPAMEREAM